MKLLPVLLLVGLMAACARLPEYARPRFHDPGDDAAFGREGFVYRALTVEDFQSTALPEGTREHHRHINAHSCISIRPANDARARISQGGFDGRMVYAGSFSQVRFEAIFEPSCSWWNPEIPGHLEAYVLQHEQIHFALAELSARRLTRDAAEELQDYLAVDNSYRAVQEEMSAKLRDLTRDAMTASFAEHTDFDEETSLFYDPRAQEGWMKEVTERLEEERP